MEKQGWIKLHRKILDNETLQNPNSFMVFVKLLLLADHKTGKIKIGRKKLADLCGVKPSTCYRAYQRLKTARIVSDDGDSYCLTYSICNWGSYQTHGSNHRSNESLTHDADGNTITRRKKKEERNTTTLYATPEDPMPEIENDGLISNDLKREHKQQTHPDIDRVIKHFEEVYGIKLKQIRNQRSMAFNLVKRYSLEKTLSAINVSHQMLAEKYAPQILDLRDLWEKWDKLAAFLIKQRAAKQSKVAIITEDEE